MTSQRPVLVVIEAPGKRDGMRRIALDVFGSRPCRVWATGGHFREHAGTLWPLGIDEACAEPGRQYDVTRYLELRRLATDCDCYIATDMDAEGHVIARDVADAVQDVAASIRRVVLTSLDVYAGRAAFAQARPWSPEVARRALAGDARRIVDRTLGHACSRAGVPVGRVFTALLREMAESDPVIGHVTLRIPAADGGRPFVARVPVTARNEAEWRARAATVLPPARVQTTEPEPCRPLDFAAAVLTSMGREVA